MMANDFVLIGNCKWLFKDRAKCPFCNGDLEEQGGNGIATEFFNCSVCGFTIGVKYYLSMWGLRKS